MRFLSMLRMILLLARGQSLLAHDVVASVVCVLRLYDEVYEVDEFLMYRSICFHHTCCECASILFRYLVIFRVLGACSDGGCVHGDA